MDTYIDVLLPEPFGLHASDYEQCQQWLQPDSSVQAMEALFSPDGLIGTTSSTFWGAEKDIHCSSSSEPSFDSNNVTACGTPPCSTGPPYPWLGAQGDQVDSRQLAQWPTAIEILPTVNAASRHLQENRFEPTSIGSSRLVNNATRDRNERSKVTQHYVPTADTIHDVLFRTDEVKCIKPQKKGPYRVKNQAAAKRYRQRSKQYEINLVAKEKQMEEDRIRLQVCATALKNEVLSLRSHILDHSECRCEVIQQYITRTATTISGRAFDARLLPSDGGSVNGREEVVAAPVSLFR